MNLDIITSKKIDQCLITSLPVTKVLDFGQHSYADTFISQDQYHLSEPVFPLQVMLCPDSGMIQLGYVSNAEARYNLYSYSYTSSNSKTARDHWDRYAATIKNTYGVNGLVVEIGSNDGYLIGQFNGEATTALGVDSSKEMCRLAKNKGVETVHGLFDFGTAQSLKNTHGTAKIIMANNVFNHANDPLAFAKAVGELLDPESGVFVFEVPYWLSMVQSGRFTDMVYHEHPSYFTVKSLWNLLKIAGLEITDYQIVDYHGGSLRVHARCDTGADMPDLITHAILQEHVAGIFLPEFYQNLQRKFELQRAEWLYNFNQIYMTDPDAVFIGIGAAAKANTWLTWHGLNATHLHCITDASEYKQGKYTPLSRIPILGDNEFANHPAPYALILSWNISEGLKKSILNINPNTRFISQ
jgi:SAM-dependent methyltransferase